MRLARDRRKIAVGMLCIFLTAVLLYFHINPVVCFAPQEAHHQGGSWEQAVITQSGGFLPLPRVALLVTEVESGGWASVRAYYFPLFSADLRIRAFDRESGGIEKIYPYWKWW